VLVAILFHSSSPSSPVASSSATSSASAPLVPNQEAEFINTVSVAQRGSAQAANDMQRGGIKATRDEAICGLFAGSFTVENWVGTVKTIDSNSDGKGIMGISLAEEITLTTWNNDLSDIGDNTLIQPGTELFQTASSLRKGQTVSFSGSFMPKREGCVDESSITLRGKLDDPEFIFRFARVGPPGASTRHTDITSGQSAVLATPSQALESKSVSGATPSMGVRWPDVTVLGFTAGESPQNATAHAVALGMTQFSDCTSRAHFAEYVDCKFSGTTGESMEDSFLTGQLQRVNYRFSLLRYEEILGRIEQLHGTPRTLTDPNNPSYEVSKEWGGYNERFSISLGKTVDRKGEVDGGVAEIMFNPMPVGESR